jgi:general secretion pathway protein L
MSATPTPESRPRQRSKSPSLNEALAGWTVQAGRLRSRALPGASVVLMDPQGGESVWRDDRRLVGAVRKPKFMAILLPEDLVLRRSLLLPRMSAALTDQALEIEARSHSPFPAGELVWGSLLRDADGGQKHAEILIAPRSHIVSYLQTRWPETAAADRQPEVWAMSEWGVPVVIRGFGETHRLNQAGRQRRGNWALLTLSLIIATAAAVTPTMQLRMRALEAATAYEAVARRVAPLVRKRDELTALNDRISALGVASAERVDPAAVIDYLTKILPDDTYLYNLEVQNTKVTANGFTVDAAALLQRLSADPRLKNVRSPSAVTRQPGATKEAFVVEFTLQPLPTVAAAAPVVGVALAPASAPAIAPATAAAAALQAQKPLSTGAAVTPAPGASPFVIGGSK